ncbi:unnamed protein product [Prunus armeniaca]
MALKISRLTMYTRIGLSSQPSTQLYKERKMSGCVGFRFSRYGDTMNSIGMVLHLSSRLLEQ